MKLSKWRKEHGPRDLTKLFPLTSFLSVSPEGLAYAAALIEGEGHLWVGTFRGKTGKRALYPAVILRMVEREPLDYMMELFGGNVTSRLKVKGSNRTLHSYQACGRKAGAICLAIQPYLKIVRKQVWASLLVELAEIVGRYSHYDVQRDPALQEKMLNLQQRVTALRTSHANL